MPVGPFSLRVVEAAMLLEKEKTEEGGTNALLRRFQLGEKGEWEMAIKSRIFGTSWTREGGDD